MRHHHGVLSAAVVALTLGVCMGVAWPQTSRGVAGDAATARQPQKWAIVIGVGAYQDAGLTDLPKAVNDARAVRDALVSMEDGFPKDNVVLLSDDAGPDRQPTRSNIIRYVSSYLKLAGSDDTALVYFAGHGMTEGDQLHLLPHDATLSNIGLTGYPFAELERTLREAKARRKVLILDACHSGTGRGSATLSGAAVKELERAAEGMVTLASCSAEELSHEMPDTDHGAFTHFLLEALGGEADRDGDGYVSAHEASVYTWDATRRWAASQGLAQTPWRRDEGSGEILLAKVRVVQGSPGPPRAHEVRPPVAEPEPKPEPEVRPPVAEPKPEPEPEPEERPSAAELKRAPGEPRTVDLGGGVKLGLVWIPPGEFVMGSGLSPDQVAAMYGGGESDKLLFEDERPQHQVRISRGFWMGEKEVMNGEFGRFVEETGYQTEAEKEGRGRIYRLGAGWEDTPGASWRKPGWETKPEEPVVLVSWNDAKAYCAWLAKKTGDAYRLPTEAEWEYACRAGSTTEFWWGDRMEDGAGKVNGADQTRLPNGSPWSRGFPFVDGYWRTAPVGSSAPNAWGLYDMLGNVWEWCEDWYGAYTSGAATDPRGPAMGLNRVSRGGSWYDYSGFCRSAFRNGDAPKDRNSFLGFRIVLPAVR